MAVKVAINGFGRIGRLAFRQMFGGERGIIGNLTFKPAAERICGNVDRVPGRWGGLQVFVRRKTGRTICFDEVLLL